MHQFRSVIQFEQSFERYLQIVEHLPWAPLRLRIIDFLYRETDRMFDATNQLSYLKELGAHLGKALQLSEDLQFLDPQFLEQQVERLNRYPANQQQLSSTTDRQVGQKLAQTISAGYFRLQAWNALIECLQRFDLIKDFSESPESVLKLEPQEFYHLISPHITPQLKELFSKELEEGPFESSVDKIAGMFVVKYETFRAGIIGKVGLDSIRIIRQSGQDKIRFANHIVDANDIIADQARDLLTHFRIIHRLSENQHLNLAYNIDQPPSLVMGNSIGLAMAILGHIGLDTYQKNRPLQPMIYDDVAVTGAINKDGKITGVNDPDVEAKISAAFFGPYKIVVVPPENENSAHRAVQKLQQKYPNRALTIIAVPDVIKLRNQRDIIHLQRRRVITRAKQVVKKYNTAMSYGLLGALILVTILGYVFIVKNSTPTSAVPYKDKVIIKNKYGFKIWETASFGRKITSEKIKRLVKIEDINGDANPEVIVGYEKFTPAPLKGDVVCYTNDGNILWQYHPGKTVYYGDNIYDDFFGVSKLYICDFDSNGQSEIVATGNQTFFPNYIVVLSNTGEVLSKFWHSGNIYDLSAFEVYGENNYKELIATAVNNEYCTGVIFVLDPFLSNGTSPQQDHYYTNQKLDSGNEIYFVRFPSTHFKSKKHRDTVRNLIISNNHRLLLKIYPSVEKKPNGRLVGSIVYIFTPDMKVNFVDLSDEYYHLYSRYYPNRPNLPYNDPEVLKHFRQVEYWDGSDWTTTPTVNSHYLETLKNQTATDSTTATTH